MELSRFFDQFERLQERATWRSVFGEPQGHGEVVVIPLAHVVYGFGGGFGSGTGAAEETGKTSAGEGGGLGGGLAARPAGVVKIAGGDVTVEPYVDGGRIALAGICLAGWSVFWITKTVRDVARGRARRS